MTICTKQYCSTEGWSCKIIRCICIDDDSTSVLVMRSSRYNGGRHADEVMRLGGGW